MEISADGLRSACRMHAMAPAGTAAPLVATYVTLAIVPAVVDQHHCVHYTHLAHKLQASHVRILAVGCTQGGGAGPAAETGIPL